MKYRVETVTRIEEGASFEDILEGDAYEIAYLIYDETGEMIWDTTDRSIAEKYMGTEIETEIIIIPMEMEDYLKIKPENAWDFPLSEMEFLIEQIENGDRIGNRFAVINNRLYELDEE